MLFEPKYNGRDADVWSCGVSLYVLLTGVFPFSRPADEVPPAQEVTASKRALYIPWSWDLRWDPW